MAIRVLSTNQINIEEVNKCFELIGCAVSRAVEAVRRMGQMSLLNEQTVWCLICSRSSAQRVQNSDWFGKEKSHGKKSC